MQHIVYLGLKPLFLTSQRPEQLQQNTLVERAESQEAVQSFLTRLEHDTDLESGVLVHPDVDTALEIIKQQFLFIQAAGGLVWSDKDQILLIFRRGKWDLPKGKLDPGEQLEDCAVREVEEETGLTGIRIGQQLGSTYHTYYQGGIHILKESVWYLMQAPHEDNLQPQTEEDIEQCIWVNTDQLHQYLPNTYRTIADVLQAALPLLEQLKQKN
jgi:8-oxo-dGTP pyrophosphatase MutT (NUDIX family)